MITIGKRSEITTDEYGTRTWTREINGVAHTFYAAPESARPGGAFVFHVRDGRSYLRHGFVGGYPTNGNVARAAAEMLAAFGECEVFGSYLSHKTYNAVVAYCDMTGTAYPLWSNAKLREFLTAETGVRLTRPNPFRYTVTRVTDAPTREAAQTLADARNAGMGTDAYSIAPNGETGVWDVFLTLPRPSAN